MSDNFYLINKNILFNHKGCYLHSKISNTKEPIGANPSGLLLYLIENHGNTVTIDEISNYFLERGRFVNAATATQYISKLRKAMKLLDEKTSVIATIKGGGYHIPRYIDICTYPIAEENISENEDRERHNSLPEVSKTEEDDGCRADNKKSPVKTYLLCFISLISFFLGISWSGVNYKDIFGIDNIDYRFETIRNGCNVYIDHDFPEKNTKLESLIFNDIDLYCKSKKYVYLTYFDHSENYSLFFCDSSIQDKKKRQICSSFFRLNND